MTRKSIAYHEAGHAVAAVVLKRGVRNVTIRPRNDYAGRLLQRTGVTETSSHKALRKDLIITAAGPVAQARMSKCSTMRVLGGVRASGDREAIENMLNALGEFTLTQEYYAPLGKEISVQDMTAGTRRAISEARSLLREHWPAVERVAKALLKHGRLTGTEVRALVQASRTNRSTSRPR